MQVQSRRGRSGPATLAIALMAALAVQFGPSPAHAQSFFEALLGLVTPKHQPLPRHAPTPAPVYHPPGGNGFNTISPYYAQPTQPSTGGRYTTLCVRMCDGFYFPISHSTRRQEFNRDAKACQSRCGGSEARLFYRPSSSGDMKEAVDLTGRAYARLPIAFLHRKKYISGCTCRPAPWSAAERARHRRYSIAEAGPAGTATSTVDNEPTAAGGARTVAPTALNIADSHDVSAGAGEANASGSTSSGASRGQVPAAVAAAAPAASRPISASTAGAGTNTSLESNRTVVSARSDYRSRQRPDRRSALANGGNRRAVRVKPQYTSAPGLFGLFGGSQTKYSRHTWPGDRR